MSYITKSKYCRFVQCPKIIWMDKYMSEAAGASISEDLLETGQKVGKIARGYFGDFECVEYNDDLDVMCRETDKLLKDGVENIAEASFLYKDCFCSVDLLHSEGGKLQIIEVKSSTEPKDIHFEDISFQYYVLSELGYIVDKVFIMHINNEYVRKGELDLKQLFTLVDGTDEALKRQDGIEEKIKGIRKIYNTQAEPDIRIDLYCDKPYECMYKSYCHRFVPEPSIFSVHLLKAATKYKYYHEGIITFEDIIKKHPKMTDKQYAQVNAVYNNELPIINKKAISEFLNTLTYPLYHLDFETFQQAIPEFDGVKPYMQIPFQYSLHVQRYKNSPEEHYEFLAKEGEDPRRKLAERLCKDIPDNVCALAYNMSFEKTVIKNLALQFPDLSAHLMKIHDNMHDLMVPFQKQHYYRKEFQGSYSIKYVLPALCPNDPELDYHALEGVHNGSEAMATYAGLTEHTKEEIEIIRKQLLAYCRLDTLAMVKVLEKLYEITEG